VPVLPLVAVLLGLALLVWSAGRFVSGAAALAGHLGMAPLLIGMLVIGFGTSAPEMLIAVIAALDNSPGIAIGNAIGSNIANIGLILGVTAVISPVMVHSDVLRRQLPFLLAATILIIPLALDLHISRLNAAILLGAFAIVVGWQIRNARATGDSLATAVEGAQEHRQSLPWAIFNTVLGLALLVASSRALVWGAVEIARLLGVSDLVIGLTVVAVGTSLPELASSLAAIRKGEHDLAVGSVIGSNLFNTMPVVALAALISPMDIAPEVIERDLPVMAGLTVLLVVFCAGFGRRPRVNRLEGALLATAFVAYTAYLVVTAVA
jgi:cation:H+ antiporter